MDYALLENLISEAGLNSKFVGGLVVALLYLTVGLLGAIGSIFIFRRVFQGRWEQVFWASFLVVIALFYLSFAAYFEASDLAWRSEVVAVLIFLGCAMAGLYSRPILACGYGLHALWDLSHSLSGPSLAGLSLTTIPLGYGVFCLTYDFTVAGYLLRSGTLWHEPGKFDPYFWRRPE